MAKGALYTRIRKDKDTHMNIINVHLQAWESNTLVRERQAMELRSFIHELAINDKETLMMLGDFNVNITDSEMPRLCDIMGMWIVPILSGHPQFSVDPSRNNLCGNDDPSSYRNTMQWNGCYDSFLKTGICSCCPRQLLDHILISSNHSPPVNEPRLEIWNDFRANIPFSIHYNLLQKKQTVDLSDHFPISSVIDFPTCPDTYILECSRPQVSAFWLTLYIFLTIPVLFVLWTQQLRRK
jgi:hypothetical protein